MGEGINIKNIKDGGAIDLDFKSKGEGINLDKSSKLKNIKLGGGSGGEINIAESSSKEPKFPLVAGEKNGIDITKWFCMGKETQAEFKELPEVKFTDKDDASGLEIKEVSKLDLAKDDSAIEIKEVPKVMFTLRR